MRSDQLDLSLSVEMDEINSVDRCDALGWTIYTQEGDVVTHLVFDGLGCYDGLQHLGQTFYYSRVMTEAMNAAALSLTSVNRNYSVFLDGVLIYTDCPEQDNRIGYLTLPARDWERTENIVIPLPEDYAGKTLTIAQSTPLYTDSPRMATRVIPSAVTLYCSYAYESALIAESFQTAYVAASAYAVGILLLAVLLHQADVPRLLRLEPAAAGKQRQLTADLLLRGTPAGQLCQQGPVIGIVIADGNLHDVIIHPDSPLSCLCVPNCIHPLSSARQGRKPGPHTLHSPDFQYTYEAIRTAAFPSSRRFAAG